MSTGEILLQPDNFSSLPKWLKWTENLVVVRLSHEEIRLLPNVADICSEIGGLANDNWPQFINLENCHFTLNPAVMDTN